MVIALHLSRSSRDTTAREFPWPLVGFRGAERPARRLPRSPRWDSWVRSELRTTQKWCRGGDESTGFRHGRRRQLNWGELLVVAAVRTTRPAAFWAVWDTANAITRAGTVRPSDRTGEADGERPGEGLMPVDAVVLWPPVSSQRPRRSCSGPRTMPSTLGQPSRLWHADGTAEKSKQPLTCISAGQGLNRIL